MLFYFVSSKIFLFGCVCGSINIQFFLFRMVLNFINYKYFLYLLQFICKLFVLLHIINQ